MKHLLALGSLLLFAAAANAALLYDRSIETGSRANAGNAGFTAGAPADANRELFDDVPIPVARLGTFTSIDITRVTVGIRRIGLAPATDIIVHWATMTTVVTPPDTQLDTPPHLLGSASLAANGASSVTQLVTFGDGVTPIANVPLNMDLIAGFGTLGIGVRISNADSNLNGWRITSGPDANAAGIIWMYDPGHTAQVNDEGAYNFGATVPASFYIIVEGNAVPEPASLALLALGALFIRRR